MKRGHSIYISKNNSLRKSNQVKGRHRRFWISINIIKNKIKNIPVNMFLKPQGWDTR